MKLKDNFKLFYKSSSRLMFPELASARYLLQQINPSDQQFIFEGLSDPQVIEFYGVSFSSFESTAQQMEFYDSLIREGSGTWWKVVDRQTGERTGAIGFNNYQPKHKKAEVGYWLLPSFWGKGIIGEVLPIVINYLRKQYNIHRIEALIEDGNDRSCKALEKAGFIHEGLQRDCEIKNGKYISLHVYALITFSY
jgi:[ribosomal protein S5]-alanine N-acetyltransferase